jgi:hypothetical protein
MSNTADVTGGKPIAVQSQSISGVNAINPLVAFYNIHGGKREVLFLYFVPDTTRDEMMMYFFFNRTSGMEGSITVNGMERNLSSFRKLSCYIMQDNQLHGNLNVEEAMAVATALKLPTATTRTDKQEVVSKNKYKSIYFSSLIYVTVKTHSRSKPLLTAKISQ